MTSTRTAKQQYVNTGKITTVTIFLWHHFTTTTWRYLISCFVENANTRHSKDKRLSFSFPELRQTYLEFTSRKKCQHLTNWTRWNKSDKVWSSATSLFKWRFRSLKLLRMSARQFGWGFLFVRRLLASRTSTELSSSFPSPVSQELAGSQACEYLQGGISSWNSRIM